MASNEREKRGDGGGEIRRREVGNGTCRDELFDDERTASDKRARGRPGPDDDQAQSLAAAAALRHHCNAPTNCCARPLKIKMIQFCIRVRRKRR